MAEKDLTEKILLDYNDVFADIVNVLVFSGKKEIKPSSLGNMQVHAQYKAEDNVLHEEERDVFKAWKECGIEIALCGLENQTDMYQYMPARVIGYDGASYRAQLLDKTRKSLVPVVTLVLYFGEKHWSQPKSLSRLFGEYPKELREYVNDYKIHVFEIAWLSEETINRFESDFQVVARFFSDKRKYGKDYIPEDPRIIEHVDAVLKFLSVMTKDRTYGELRFSDEERRTVNMCTVAQKLISIGKAEGEATGEAKGEAKGRAEERARIIKRYALRLMEENPQYSAEQAEEEAKRILL